MTGTWDGAGERVEKCSISVDRPASGALQGRRTGESGAAEILQSPAGTETWEGDGRVAEKSSISVDRPASTPYKHTPSTNSSSPDRKNPLRRGAPRRDRSLKTG